MIQKGFITRVYPIRNTILFGFKKWFAYDQIELSEDIEGKVYQEISGNDLLSWKGFIEESKHLFIVQIKNLFSPQFQGFINGNVQYVLGQF
jgi:hypothetical protein